MLARRIADVISHVPIVLFTFQVAALLTGDAGIAASGGGDFPIRRL